MAMQNETILVIGSTGKTGRRIAGKLADLGYWVRHGSRRSSTPFDWEKPGTWNAALAGVQRALVRQPREFLDFCHAAAAYGAWGRAA
jgi:uncharacterized protein YbjT (DUF2867 family)